jgi:hypothetical protein
MSKPSVSGFGRVLIGAVACALLAIPAFADSQARIVRLSDVHGSVLIDKNTGAGFESAFLNLPITQGTQIKTGENGRAEIEFEDGSALRLAPNATVVFSTLAVNDAGKHTSSVTLGKGTAYVNWLGKSGDQLSVDFATEKLTLDREAHFRVNSSTEMADLSVFKGTVEVNSPSGTVAVQKKKTATFRATDDGKSTVADKIAEQPLDSWDKEASAYHDEYANVKKNPSPFGYGGSDLGYYGNYSNVAGYGMLWQPYFTGAGWDPFMDGAWSWYPGYGYMFVSAYPWGWTPYRYGSWLSIPGRGWMWQPGGWNSWTTVPRINGLALSHPLVPPRGSVHTVVVGRGGPIARTPPTRLGVSSGSAGLGIARGSLQNMHHLNTEVAKGRTPKVHPAPQFSATSHRGATGISGASAGNRPGAGASRAPASAPSAGHSAPAAHPSGGAHR